MYFLVSSFVSAFIFVCFPPPACLSVSFLFLCLLTPVPLCLRGSVSSPQDSLLQCPQLVVLYEYAETPHSWSFECAVIPPTPASGMGDARARSTPGTLKSGGLLPTWQCLRPCLCMCLCVCPCQCRGMSETLCLGEVRGNCCIPPASAGKEQFRHWGDT